jgi:hypothetical protein
MDCTGHGVPGALMSLIGHNALETAILKHNEHRPDLILEKVDLYLREALHQSQASKLRDGMEGTIMAIGPDKQQVLIASAKGKFWIKAKDQWEFLRSSKRGLGSGILPMGVKPFELYTYNMNDYDQFEVILSSDGLLDQFGGSLGKKLGRKNFTHLINQQEVFKDFENEIGDLFDIWVRQGVDKQIDDVCIAHLPIKPKNVQENNLEEQLAAV